MIEKSAMATSRRRDPAADGLARGSGFVPRGSGVSTRRSRRAPVGKPSVGRGELTIRELDVLRLIALGHTNGEIAGRLGVSVRTIESHRGRIQAKTGRTRRADLVALALAVGLLDVRGTAFVERGPATVGIEAASPP